MDEPLTSHDWDVVVLAQVQLVDILLTCFQAWSKSIIARGTQRNRQAVSVCWPCHT